MARQKVRGRFETREELVAYVWSAYKQTKATVTDIAAAVDVSVTTVHNIIDKKEGLTEYMESLK